MYPCCWVTPARLSSSMRTHPGAISVSRAPRWAIRPCRRKLSVTRRRTSALAGSMSLMRVSPFVPGIGSAEAAGHHEGEVVVDAHLSSRGHGIAAVGDPPAVGQVAAPQVQQV